MELLVVVLLAVIAYMLYKNRKAKSPAPTFAIYPAEHPSRLSQSLDDEINRFAVDIRSEINLAEKYMQASYMEWRLARERENRIYHQTGVILPRTPTREKQDAYFAELEKKLEGKRQLLIEHHRQEADEASRVLEVERRTATVMSALSALEADTK